MLVELDNVVFGYAKRPVVQIDHLTIEHGRSLGIFGPNGSGKTTLVRGISGLLDSMSGRVVRQAALRIGYLPQHRAIDQHWPMSGLDAALLAPSARLQFGWVGAASAAGTVAVTRAMMRRLGVEDLARRSFAKLSGGQQQRILLAGAMAAEPQVLLLDEPTDGLDVRSRQDLLELLREFSNAGLATVVISHEIEDLQFLCDAVARIHPADDPEHPAHVEVIPPKLLVGPYAGANV